MEKLNDLSPINKPKHIEHLKPKTLDDIEDNRRRKMKELKYVNILFKNINETIKQIIDCSNVYTYDKDGNLVVINKLIISDTSIDESEKIIYKSELTIDFTYLSYYFNCLKYIFITLYDLVDIYHFTEYNTLINTLKNLSHITVTVTLEIEDDIAVPYDSTYFYNDSKTFMLRCEELEKISNDINKVLLNFDFINNLNFVTFDKKQFNEELKIQLKIFNNMINNAVCVLNSIKEIYDKLPEKREQVST